MVLKDDSEDDEPIKPHYKEGDRGIIEAFSKSDEKVLTNSEIAEQVSLGKRQVRRRLKDLNERGILGLRDDAGGTKIAWLDKEIKQPVTVDHPIFALVFDHTSVQMVIIGLVIGVVAVLELLTVALTVAYQVQPPYFSTEQLLIWGIGLAVFSGLFIIAGVLIAGIEWSIRRIRMNYRINSD